MKLPRKKLSRKAGAAFTLVEVLIASSIFVLTIIALVAVQIFALRIYTLAATKLSATSSARKVLDDLRNQIQSATTVDVGTYFTSYGNPTNFALIPTGTQQIGNALRISNSTTLNTLVFLQPSNGGTNFATSTSTDANGNRINTSTNFLILETYDGYGNIIVTNGVSMSNTITGYITNADIFTAVDFTGTNILTSYSDCRVIQIKMFFSQWEYPIAIIGTNDYNAYDYYRLQTRVTRRAVND